MCMIIRLGSYHMPGLQLAILGKRQEIAPDIKTLDHLKPFSDQDFNTEEVNIEIKNKISNIEPGQPYIIILEFNVSDRADTYSKQAVQKLYKTSHNSEDTQALKALKLNSTEIQSISTANDRHFDVTMHMCSGKKLVYSTLSFMMYYHHSRVCHDSKILRHTKSMTSKFHAMRHNFESSYPMNNIDISMLIRMDLMHVKTLIEKETKKNTALTTMLDITNRMLSNPKCEHTHKQYRKYIIAVTNIIKQSIRSRSIVKRLLKLEQKQLILQREIGDFLSSRYAGDAIRYIQKCLQYVLRNHTYIPPEIALIIAAYYFDKIQFLGPQHVSPYIINNKNRPLTN